MSDLISRQAAIDALYHVDEYNGRSIKSLRNLPSAQPEIIHCRDCAKSESDSLFQDIWCDGEKVTAEHYCGYAERREDG